MIDWLIFAEKHDQANKIAEVLFDKGKPNGNYSDGGFGGRSLSSVLSGEVRIVHFSGHIYEMAMPPEQNDAYSLASKETTNRFGITYGGEPKDIIEVYGSYPIELNLNKIKWQYSQKKFKTISQNMKKLYTNSKGIVVATDFDNEGEMIFRNWQSNNIHNPKWDNMYRAKMNSTTPKDIKIAFENLIPYKGGDSVLESMYAQGFARSIADYEYGLSFTFYGWMLSKKNNTVRGQYGRLKNSLLGVVYNQELEHDQFKPSSNYRIDIELPNGDILKGTEDFVFKTPKAAQDYITEHDLPQKLEIQYTESEIVRTPPKLYSRNELLVSLMKHHEKVLDRNDTWNTHLQALYDRHSLLSYPRTDVQYISDEIYKSLQKLAATKSVQRLLNKRIESVLEASRIKDDIIFDHQKNPLKKHVDNSKLEGESHFALIPTDKEPANIENLSPAEKAVYLEDLYHTMSIFCNDSILIQRQYSTEDGCFKSTQKKTKQHGYQILLNNIKEDEGGFIDTGIYDVKYNISEVKAKRPPLFTKMSLVSMTKRVNWGTSATRDATIEDLINKGSIILKDGYLRINPELKGTIKLLLDLDLIDFNLTSDWQLKLNKLSNYEEAIKFIKSTRSDTKSVHLSFEEILD
ncbi:DNA topoisomerase [Staphylococcus aureus]|uniref:DNA topoisomerase n=1 Tax=Staphylococcus aureus TaxID=1280 RepID=UPI000DFA40A5|nr:DNA topoisomerase [Staphylococcus aureus]SUL87559.1 DNA topoisomerase III topB [Staphylococcus aureus]